MNARGITDNGLAELLCLLSTKKGDDYSTTMSWIRAYSQGASVVKLSPVGN